MASSQRTGNSPISCGDRCGKCTSRCHRDYHGLPGCRETLERLFQMAHLSLKKEILPVGATLGRVCAEGLYANWTIPPADTAGHDGVAFRHEQGETGTLLPGQYALLGMGVPIPAEYDTLAPYELFELEEDGTVRFRKLPCRGEGITPAGSSVKAGEELLPADSVLTASTIALLRSAGVERVPVWKRPRAAILPVGSSIVPPGTPPKAGEYTDANSLLLRLAIEEQGSAVEVFPPLPDDAEPIRLALLAAAEQYDFVILTGGTGNGGERYGDPVPTAVAQAGEVITHGVSIRPGGKATLVAAVKGKAVLCLPGPMHAALLMTEQLVVPLAAHCLHQDKQPHGVTATSLGRFPKRDGDAPFMPHVVLTRTEQGYQAAPIRMGDNADTFVRANAVAVLEPGREYLPGEQIRVIPLPGTKLQYLGNPALPEGSV